MRILITFLEMMETRVYKNSHEAQWEVFHVEFIGVIMVLLRNLCLSVIFQHDSEKFTGFLVEFITLIFPMLFCLTILSEYLNTLIFVILLICVGLGLIQTMLDKPLFYLTRYTDYLSYFRNSMFIGTAVAILAVDFNVFPKRFGKTSSYGISVMDIGTAMFVMSMALSEYLMAHRPQKPKSNSTKSSSSFPIPVFAILLGIGLIRELFAHFSGYNHSTIEYGEHWNFFITLGCLKLFTSLFPYPFSIPIGLTIGVVYQSSLNLGLEQFIMREDRNSLNIFDANREGICSLMGYIFEYSLVLVYAKILASIDGIFNPSYKSVTLCFVLGGITYLLQLLSMGLFGEPSRRIANTPYILSMVTMKLLVLGFLQLIQIHGVLRNNEKDNSQTSTKSLSLLESISGNCLLFFLIANLGTGFVNSILNTHKVTNVILQMAILISYNFGICFIIYLWNLYNNKHRRKSLTSNNGSALLKNVIIEK